MERKITLVIAPKYSNFQAYIEEIAHDLECQHKLDEFKAVQSSHILINDRYYYFVNSPEKMLAFRGVEVINLGIPKGLNKDDFDIQIRMAKIK